MTSASPTPKECHKTKPSLGYTVRTSTLYASSQKKVMDCEPEATEDIVQEIVVRNRRTSANVSYITILISVHGDLEVSRERFKNIQLDPSNDRTSVSVEIEGTGIPPYQGHIDIDIYSSFDEIESDSRQVIARRAGLHWRLQPALRIKKPSKAS